MHHEERVAAEIHGLLNGTDIAGPQAVAALTRATEAAPLTRLDAWEHALRQQLWAHDAKQPPSRWSLWQQPAQPLSWLDVCNGDGRKRESILRTSPGGAPGALFFAFALRRLNDWVPQVRTAAREHLLRIASASDPQHVAEALWAVLATCSSWERMADDDRHVLTALIELEEPGRALKSRIMRAAAGPVSTVLVQAARARSVDMWFEDVAHNAVQPAVRARAYRVLLERRVRWRIGRKWRMTDPTWSKGRVEPVVEEREVLVHRSLHDLVSDALTDSSAMVRRAGADAVIGHLASVGAQGLVWGRQLAADPCASVAERGRFVLKSLGESG